MRQNGNRNMKIIIEGEKLTQFLKLDLDEKLLTIHKEGKAPEVFDLRKNSKQSGIEKLIISSRFGGLFINEERWNDLLLEIAVNRFFFD